MPKRAKSAVAQLKVRLREPMRARLEKSAKQRGISLNAEIANRLEQSFDWDEKFGDSRKMLAEHEEVLRSGLEAAMRHEGYQPVRLDQGIVWLAPGAPIGKLSFSIDAAAVVDAMTPELTGIIARALANVAKDGSEQ